MNIFYNFILFLMLPTFFLSGEDIKIGNTSPYSGPLSVYSTVSKVEAAYFNMINEKGGVNGRKILFLSRDDGYNPAKSLEATRDLVENDKVSAMFNQVGFPGVLATRQYLNDKKVPQLFVSSTSSLWNNPKEFPWTIAMLLTPSEEAKVVADYILKNFPDGKIALLVTESPSDQEFIEAFKTALGTNQITISKYRLDEPTIDSNIIALKNSGADIFINNASAKFASQAIKAARDIDWKLKLHYLSIYSTSIHEIIKPAGIENTEGIISLAAFKDPSDPQWKDDPAYLEYATFMKKYFPEGDVNDSMNVYGYTAAQVLVQNLKQCGDDLSRDNIMKQARSLKMTLPMLMPGIEFNSSLKQSQSPIHQAYMVQFKQGRFVIISKLLEL
jgi:branched-chain amino acid transport system substrate-binding protein